LLLARLSSPLKRSALARHYLDDSYDPAKTETCFNGPLSWQLKA
jgi:hypothetical protein